MVKKSLIVLSFFFFGLVLFFIVAGIFSSSTYSGSMEQIYPYPIDDVWEVLTNRAQQTAWRKDIVKQNTTDRGWVEYVSEKDSIEYKMIKTVPKSQFVYGMRSRKFELIAAFNARLFKLSDTSTKVVIYESSKNFNRYASVFFLLVDKELDLKIEHQNISEGLRYKSAQR